MWFIYKKETMEPVNKESAPVADDVWDESAPLVSSPVPDVPEQRHFRNDRNDRNDRRHRGGGRYKQALGYGRGAIKGYHDHEYNDGNRQGFLQRGQNDRGYGNQSNPNFHRPNQNYGKHNEDNWEIQKDHRQRHNSYRKPFDEDNRQRENNPRQHDDRMNRAPRYGDKNDRYEDDHQKQGNDYHSRDMDNHSRDKFQMSRQRDNKDNLQRSHFSKDGSNSETKDAREIGFQGQGAWRGRNNSLNFNKEETKEAAAPVRSDQSQNQNQGQGAWRTRPNFNLSKDENKDGMPARGDQTQNQGNLSNKTNRRNTGKVEVPDVLTEFTNQDLFLAPGEFSLAHCVAQDFRMGSGIAVKFREEFKRVGELLDQGVQVGGCAHLEDKGRYIFYLVTKEISSGKPTIEDLKRSLEVMKEKCLKFGVKKLAMPRIGCGLDKLNWTRVKATINEVFHDACLEEIRIYEFNMEGLPEGEGNKQEGKVKLSVRYRQTKLVDMEPETALLFLGTENGHMDATALSLNVKHHFEAEYKKLEKTVGKTVCCKRSDNFEYVYSLIVAKTQNDKVSFTKFEECCSHLSQTLRKDKFQYVGIESPQGWSNEKIFFEKILTVMRNSLPKSLELYVCYPSAEMDVFKMIRDDGKAKEHTTDK